MFCGTYPRPMTTDDRQQIVDLLSELTAILDGRRWDALPRVFTADATAYGATGRAAVEALVRSFLGGCGPSQHLLGNHLVTVDGDRASATTKIRVMHQGADERAHLTYECLGDYHDRFVRTADGWRITSRDFEVSMAFGDPSVLQPG